MSIEVHWSFRDELSNLQEPAQYTAKDTLRSLRRLRVVATTLIPAPRRQVVTEFKTSGLQSSRTAREGYTEKFCPKTTI